jgi:uncharacterized protein (TIGR03435 family)
MRGLHRLAVVLVLAGAGTTVLAQDPAPRLTFEVASVKRSPPASGGIRVMFGSREGDRWLAENATLRILLRNAYDVEYGMDGQIVGGPSWIDTDRFDIQATMAPGTSNTDMKSMVRTLLADRFQLRTHTERRELPVYVLVVARNDGRLGPQMRPLKVDCDAVRAARARGEKPPADPAPTCTTGMSIRRTGITELDSSGMTMAALIDNLSRAAGRPVLDRTGLTGSFAVSLRFATDASSLSPLGGPPQGVSLEPVDAPSLTAAVQEQLGLRLESRREPVAVLVVDSASSPAEN